MTNPGFDSVGFGEPPASLDDTVSRNFGRRLAETINRLLQGKRNATLAVTLTNGAASTTVLDSRISAASALVLVELTANAAALKYAAPWILPTQQKAGSVVFTHANTANTDQNFLLIIEG